MDKLNEILFIVGNGFDLHCELKSSFKSYMDSIRFKYKEINRDFSLLGKYMNDENINFWSISFFEFEQINHKCNGFINYDWYNVEELIFQILHTPKLYENILIFANMKDLYVRNPYSPLSNY